MTQIELSAIRDCIESMFEIEISAAVATIKAAKKQDEHDLIIMGQSYILGVQRARNIMDVILKDVQE